jgi:hypothetical protein
MAEVDNNDPQNGTNTVWVPPDQQNTGAGPCQGVETALDANGRLMGGQVDCVDGAEADRRRNLYASQNPGPPSGSEGRASTPAGGAPLAPMPAGRPDYGKAPIFDAPVFQWGEKWQAPTLEDAQNEPGYAFAAKEGQRALEQSAAAKGVLGSGGTLKDIASWANRFGEQNYNNVFGRSLQGYNTRFNTAKDIFDRFYTGKKDEFAPRLFEWQTNAHGADLGFQQAWNQWNRDHLSAQDIYGSGN